MHVIRGLVCAAAVILIAASTALAFPVYEQPASLSGTRTTPDGGVGGLTGTNDYASGFSLSWSIILGPGTATYTYTLEHDPAVGQSKQVSHFTIDLSADCSPTAGCVSNATLNGVPIAAGDIEFGDFDGITGGVKFDVGDCGDAGNPCVYSFTSNRLPVWGDVCVKDGGGPEVCGEAPDGTNLIFNTAFGNHDDPNPLNFVAVPDTDRIPPTQIPEPGTLLLLGTGLLGTLVTVRNRAR